VSSVLTAAGEAEERGEEPADTSPAGPSRPWPAHTGPVVGLVGLLVLFYWPLIRHFPSRVLSDGADGASFLWSYWAIPHALGHLQDPFRTHQIFWPVGADTAFNTNTPLWSVLSWPLARIFGLGVAASLVGLAVVLISGLGAYFLALRECQNRGAAFVAGVAFAFLPRHLLSTFAAFNLAHTGLIAFGLLALLRLYERPTRGRAAAAGAVLGATVLSDYTLAIFLILAGVVVAAVRYRATGTRMMATRLAQAGATAALLSLPVIAPALAAVRHHELSPIPGFGGADTFSADLLSWVVPPASHPVWGAPLTALNRSTGGIHLAYPGLVVLGLAVAGVAVATRVQRRTWGLVAVLFGLLAMGPFTHVAGHTGRGFTYLGDHFAVPLPYLLLRLVPGMTELRVPGRFADVAALGLDVLAAVALARLHGAVAARRGLRWAAMVPLAAAALTVFEFQTDYRPLQPSAVPRPYEAIAASGDSGAVLEIPLQWRDGTHRIGDNAANRDDTLFLWYATTYRQPLVSGMVARLPDWRWRRLTSMPLYRQLLSLEAEPGFSSPATFTADDLRRAGIGFVVLHRDRPEPAAAAYLARIGLRRLSSDGTVTVLEVPLPLRRL